MDLQRYSWDYLRGVQTALQIERYSAEIEADFQGIGGSNEEFEKGFNQGMCDATCKPLLIELINNQLLTN